MSTAIDHRDVVETEKPSKTLFPTLSTLFTHHAKLMSSLWKHFSRNARSFALPRSMLYTRQTAQAWTGGFRSENSHS